MNTAEKLWWAAILLTKPLHTLQVFYKLVDQDTFWDIIAIVRNCSELSR